MDDQGPKPPPTHDELWIGTGEDGLQEGMVELLLSFGEIYPHVQIWLNGKCIHLAVISEEDSSSDSASDSQSGQSANG